MKPQQTLSRIFEALDRAKVGYCVLRNYEFLLDDKQPVGSLDAVVAEADVKKFETVLDKFGFQKRTQQFSLRHKAYFKIKNLQKISFDVQVGGIYWNDIRYMDESILLRRIRRANFWVLGDEDVVVMLLIHSILGKRYFKQKYRTILLNLASSGSIDWTNVEERISLAFNRKIAKRLVDKVQRDRIQAIKISHLILYFVFKSRKHAMTLLGTLVRWIKWKRPLTLYPLISIMGPDGAGKSTFVDKISAYLAEQKRDVDTIYSGRGRNHILPITKIGKKYKAKEKRSRQNVYVKKVLYPIAAPIFALDLLLRYYVTIWPKRFKKIVITDRYYTDIILMKNVPLKLRIFLMNLFPKPTISVLLYNMPETLHKRRPEEPVEELQRQLNILNGLQYSLRIKTTSKEKDTQKAIEYIYTKLLKDWY